MAQSSGTRSSVARATGTDGADVEASAPESTRPGASVSEPAPAGGSAVFTSSLAARVSSGRR